MRISELATATGVNQATIKFYTRQGLLPAGARSGYNQTCYDERHVERLRLVRALVNTGGLSIAATKEVLLAVDDPATPTAQTLAVAQHAIPIPTGPVSASAVDRVDEIVASRGWHVEDDNPGRALVASAIDALDLIDDAAIARLLAEAANAAEIVGAADLDLVESISHRDRQAVAVVVGIVIGDRLMAGLRRMVQEHETHRRYAMPDEQLGDDGVAPDAEPTAEPASDRLT